MKYPKNLIQSQSGQAIVEYVLLLIVVVAIILGALYQFNSAMRFWADNYFGNYLSCLIESGELPSLNGNGGVPGNICGQFNQPFSLANGSPLIGGNVTNPSSSGGGTGGGVGVGAGAAAGSGNGNLTMIPTSGGGSNFGGSSNRYAAPNLKNGGGGAGKGAGGNLGGDAITDISSYSQDRIVRIPLRRQEGILGGRYRQDEEKAKDVVKVAESPAAALAKKRNELMPVPRKIASTDKPPEIEELTLGYLLRYLIIAAIIIAIVIFIGGQIMQVSKSLE